MSEKTYVETGLQNIQNYIIGIADIMAEPEIDWEKVYVYLECIDDEVEDTRAAVWNMLDDEEEDV